MHFKLCSIATILATIGLSSATPLITERQAATITPPSRYYLQSKVVGNNSDTGTNKTGLYVYSSHTGAGFGDAALSVNKTGWEGYLNGTQQLFTYPNNEGYPWPFLVQYGPYQGWYVTTISVISQTSPDDPGFFFNSSGLQYNSTSSGGWLACDWWHGSPQLFSLSSYLYGPLPSSCSKVELHPVAI